MRRPDVGGRVRLTTARYDLLWGSQGRDGSRLAWLLGWRQVRLCNRRRLTRWTRLCRSLSLAALVALEFPLLDKLLRFTTKHAVVSVGEFTLL